MTRLNTLVHQEVMLFTAPPAFIRTCISTPERIMDYYPGPLSSSVVEPNRAMICCGRSGVSLLEITREYKDDSGCIHIELTVTSALFWRPPYTPERVKQQGFFSMTEDWLIAPFGSGTRLTKTWRDIRQHKWPLLPMAYLVKKTAKGESKKIQTLWDEAFEQSLDKEDTPVKA